METLLIISSVLLWIIVLGNLLLTLTVIRRVTAGSPGERPTLAGLRVGAVAPPFSARTLDGQTRTLDDSAGRVTAMAFVAPGCRPCREFLPTLGKVDPQGTAELLLICDGDEEQTRTLMEPLALIVPVLLAPQKDNFLFQDYQVHGTPAYYLLDERGHVQASGRPGEHDPQWRRLMEAWTSQRSLTEGRAG